MFNMVAANVMRSSISAITIIWFSVRFLKCPYFVNGRFTKSGVIARRQTKTAHPLCACVILTMKPIKTMSSRWPGKIR